MSRKLIALTAVLLTFALLFGFAGCSLIPEGEEETTTTVNVKTPLPTDVTSSKDENGNIITDTDYSPEALAKNTATIFEYFNKVINEVKGKKAAVHRSDRYSLEKATDKEGNRLPYSENKYIDAAFDGYRNYMDKDYDSDIAYGEDLAKYIPVPGKKLVSTLTAEEIESATCVDDGTVRTITVTLKEPVSSSSVRKAFEIGDLKGTMSEVRKIDKYLEVGDPEYEYTHCSITIKVNIETDEVTEIKYEKSADVTAEVTGKGTLESVGTSDLTFRFNACETFTFDYTNPEEAETLK